MDVVVTLKKDKAPPRPQVEAALRDAGVSVEDYLVEIDTVFASGHASSLARLRSLPFVEDARPEPGVQLPPMRDDVPQ